METTKTSSIYQRLAAVQAQLNAPKNRKNTFGNYSYRSCEDILEAVKPVLTEHSLTLVLSDTIEMLGDRYYVKATATVYDETGETFILNTAWAREEETKKGMDASQITGSTSSYARKYALNGLFAIDDSKDADTDEHQRQSPRTESPTPMRQQPAPRTEPLPGGGPFRATANAPKPNGPTFVMEEEQQQYITTRASTARNPKDFEPLLAMVTDAPHDVAREAIFLLLIESVPSVAAMRYLRGFGMTHKCITPKCAEHMKFHAANLPDTVAA